MTLETSQLWAVPGFLGLSQDWDLFMPLLGSIKGVDLTRFSCKTFQEWGRTFNEWVISQRMPRGVLMGYSLGGRLALHALLDDPFRWKAAIIISAHPGLTCLEQRRDRLKRDAYWGYRLNAEEWESVMQAWENQDIFAKSSFRFHRRESDYQRQQLVDLMMMGSLGQQEDLSEQIAQLHLPILWMTGGKDELYCQQARRLTFRHPLSKWIEISNAGHRVPWEVPNDFVNSIREFLCHIHRSNLPT